MGKDPAFLFYPGDYLRDTQCLSEPAQVAYDRIMCEHMRNICVTQERLTFFTKRLNVDQRAEILSVLTVVPNGFQITWVADSIMKRREYSASRRKNREGNKKEKSPNIKKTSITYVSHMENVNEIENVNEGIIKIGAKSENWIGIKPKYADEKPRRVYDLAAYFATTSQLQALEVNGWSKHFSAFMVANPANVFDDDSHLYNSFKRFCTVGPNKKNGTLVDLDNL